MKKDTTRKRPIFKKLVIHRSLKNIVLPDPKRYVNVGSRKHRKDYLLLYCGYDCETTTVRTPDGWKSAVYIHQFSIAADNEVCHIYLLRTWDEIMDLFDQIRKHYDLSTERRIIIWDANLSFEFSFLQHRFRWDEVFAKEERQPLLASSGGLDFRECLSISGGSLAYLAKTYCYTQKAKGDLDYSILRNTHTPLTVTEEGYCIADVLILAEFSYMIYKTIIIKYRHIPLTKTGILLSDLKKRYTRTCRALDPYGAHKAAYERFIMEAYPGEEEYKDWFTWLFRGGYVHSNAIFTAVVLKNVMMWDITSSYPSVMLCDYVPVSAFKKDKFSAEALRTKCCIIYARFRKIRITTPHSIESKNKIIACENAVYDNGRLVSADILEVALTEIDWKIYTLFMTWDSVEICDFETAKRGKLPGFLREKMLECYTKKQKLKAEGKSDTTEYKVAKSDVNSMYGATVKRLRLDTITYDNEIGWKTQKHDKDFTKEKEKSILLPQFGIWITAHARYNLLSVIHELTKAGVDCIYSDTDSIKYIDHPAAARIIKKYNRRRAKLLKKRGYRSDFIRGLGEYDCETPDGPVTFKTLGAKRYIFYDGKEISATIAGLPKSAIKFHGNPEDTFDFFSDEGMFLDCKESLKKTTSYSDYAYSLYINGEWMEELSGVAIYEIPFTLTLSASYASYIKKMQEIRRVGFTV